MPRRVLILSSSVGAGHMRAAEAIECAVRRLDPAATVENLDVLKFTNGFFRMAYAESYIGMVNYMPSIFGICYDLLDRKPSRAQMGERIRRMMQRFNLGKFLRHLKRGSWDVVVSTHFLPAEIIAGLKRRGKLKIPQVIAVTDIDIHRLWVNEPTERYCVATDEAAINLQARGVPAAATVVTGIPVHPVFSEPIDRAACLVKHGLSGERPIVLQLSGGFGFGPIAKIHNAILQVEEPLELVAVTGRNLRAKVTLEKMEVPKRHIVHVLGYTAAMHELMAVADIILSKPGGLTTAESLASGSVLAIVNPVPGQESRNGDYLMENGTAIKLNNISTLAFKLTKLLRDRERLAAFKANALRISRPRAAFDVAEQVFHLADAHRTAS